MTEKVVQLKPKSFTGKYELPGKGHQLLRGINDNGRLPKDQAFIVALADEKVRRAYYEVAENANHLLRRWFTMPKSYRMDTIVLKHDLTQEHSFCFFLSGVQRALSTPILSFHVNVYFAPTPELIDVAKQVFQPEFPYASSVDKAKAFLKEVGQGDVICSVETLNQLIVDMEEMAAEFDHQRFGFIAQQPTGERIMILGYRYTDPYIDAGPTSTIVGFEVDGKRKTSLVEVRLEIMLDYIDMDINLGEPSKDDEVEE